MEDKTKFYVQLSLEKFLPFHRFFESAAEAYPRQVALHSRHTQEELTYEALNKKSNQLANYLLKKLPILKKGNEVDPLELPLVIGTFFEQYNPNWIISILAAWKAGFAFVLLDAYRLEINSTWGVNYRLENCYRQEKEPSLCFLLTDQRTYAQKFSTQKLPYTVFQIDSLTEQLQNQSDSNLMNVEYKADDLAYIAYTSGSTGAPKGIAVNHKGLPYCFKSASEALKISHKDKIYQAAALTFDACLWDMMLALGNGATLCMHYPIFEGESIQNLSEDLEEYQITFVTLTPTLLNFLSTELDKKRFSQLRSVVSTGEAPQNTILKKWKYQGREINNVREILNGYGPTECTIGVIMYPYENSDDVPLGRQPFEGTCLKLYSDTTANFIEEENIEGELYIGGYSLAKGYIKKGYIDQEMTNERFQMIKAERYYRTGDKVKLKQGLFYFEGRYDDELEINGERVNPFGAAEKVTAALASLDIEVSRVLVGTKVIKIFEKESKKLVAYIIPKDVRGLESITLNSLLKEITTIDKDRAPDIFYYVTAQINETVDLKQVCCINNGKLRMAASIENIEKLHQAKKLMIKSLSSNALDKGEYFSEINKIFATVLGYEHAIFFDEEISFFELGGTSLSWENLLLQLEARFQLPKVLIPIPLTIKKLSSSLSYYFSFKRIYEGIDTSPFIQIDSSLKPARIEKLALFCLPPVDGSGIKQYIKLQKNLLSQECETPTYVFRPFLINESLKKANELHALEISYASSGLMSLKQQAYYVILAIRTIQPNGPYKICGWSYGGLLAYEVAYQLKLQHQEIAYLGIFDAQPPGCLAKKGPLVLGCHLLEIINKVVKKTPGEKDREKDLIRLTVEDIQRLITNSDTVKFVQALFKYIAEKGPPKKVLYRLYIMQCNFIATLLYHGHINAVFPDSFIYQAADQEKYSECKLDDWAPYIRDIKNHYHIIKGVNHFNLLESLELSQKIKEALCPLNDNSQNLLETWNLPEAIDMGRCYLKRTEYNHLLENFFVGINSDRKILALVGISGIGKTQLAFHYAQKTYQQYSMSLWFSGENLQADYEKLGNLLYLLGHIKEKNHNMPQFVKQWLESKSNWLIVYDDTVNEKSLLDYLPRKGGHILVTSQNYLGWEQHEIIEVGPMLEKEAVQLIELISRHQDDDESRPQLAQLAKLLGYFPLGLTTVGRYLQTCSIENCINSLSDSPEEILSYEDLIDYKYNKTVFHAFELILKKISYNHYAMTLLNYCAFQFNINISEEILKNCLSTSLQESKDADFLKATRLLNNYSLISQKKQTIAVHPLLQTVLRARLEDKHKIQFLFTLFSSYYTKISDLQEETKQKLLIFYEPHIHRLTQYIGRIEFNKETEEFFIKVIICLKRFSALAQHHRLLSLVKNKLDLAICYCEKLLLLNIPNGQEKYLDDADQLRKMSREHLILYGQLLMNMMDYHYALASIHHDFEKLSTRSIYINEFLYGDGKDCYKVYVKLENEPERLEKNILESFFNYANGQSPILREIEAKISKLLSEEKNDGSILEGFKSIHERINKIVTSGEGNIQKYEIRDFIASLQKVRSHFWDNYWIVSGCYYNRAKCLLRLGMAQTALAIAYEHVENSAFDIPWYGKPKVQILIGECHVKLAKELADNKKQEFLKEAIVRFLRAERLHGANNFSTPWIQLGKVYFLKQEWEKALLYLNKVKNAAKTYGRISNATDLPKAYYYKTMTCYLHSQNMDSAKAYSYSQKLLEENKKFYPEDHPYLLEAQALYLQSLTNLVFSKGEDKKAIRKTFMGFFSKEIRKANKQISKKWFEYFEEAELPTINDCAEQVSTAEFNHRSAFTS